MTGRRMVSAAAGVLLAVLAGGTAAAAAAPAAAAPVAAQVQAQLTNGYLPYGATTTATGTLRRGTAPVAGAVVEMWVRPTARDTFTHLRDTRTNAVGAFTFRWTPSRSEQVQVRWPGTTADHWSRYLQQNVHIVIEAATFTGCFAAGSTEADTVAYTARVNPLLAGAKISAYHQTGLVGSDLIAGSTGTVAADGTVRVGPFPVARGTDDLFLRMWSARGLAEGMGDTYGTRIVPAPGAGCHPLPDHGQYW